MDHVEQAGERRRLELEKRAEALGLDAATISDLVDAFYGRVREHPRLGPIFEAEIGDHWGPHLNRMKAFWASVTLTPGVYSGRPTPTHMRLTPMVEEGDFEIWLTLFRETLDQLGYSQPVQEVFLAKAEKMAMSFKLAMFGLKPTPQRRQSA